MICNNCGCELPGEAKFCTACGTPVKEFFDDKIESAYKNHDFDYDTDATGLLAEDDLGATGVLNEYNSNDTVVLTEEENGNDVYSGNFSNNIATPIENVNSSFVNPNLQKNAFNQVNSFQGRSDTFQNKMSYLDFFDEFASKKTKSYIKSTGIIAIITAVLGLVLIVANGIYDGFYFKRIIYSAFSVIVFMVFGILILKKKSWIFTLVLACCGGISTVINFMELGNPSGIVATIIAISATVGGKKISDAYKEYISTGKFPDNEI
ncbi:MAG: zinc ribbon domain-containing protein [Oscillospiraceae bacterium]|nr:zinc ribbon domain-containing protein [Oscillospiraceae bacterium]